MGRRKSIEFWKEHIEAAANFSGSQTSYCKQHEISAQTFSNWKMKLQRTRKTSMKTPGKFACVEVLEEPRQFNQGLPDAKWVAELILGLQGDLR